MQRGERVLSELSLAGEASCLATTHRFIVRRPNRDDWIRPWWQIEAVSVEAEERLLVVSDIDADYVTIALGDGDQTRFAAVLRERVQATLVDHRDRQLEGGSVRVALRKRNGEPFLQEQVSGALRPDDELVRAALDELRTELARSIARPDLA